MARAALMELVRQQKRKHVRARVSIVNCAADFVSTFHRTQSKIAVEEVTETEFQQINDSLDSLGVFASALNVRDIVSAHQIQVKNGKTISFDTSKSRLSTSKFSCGSCFQK